MTTYRIHFNTDEVGPNGFGPWHMDVDESIVKSRVEAVVKLGMSPTVEILDNPSQNG